MNDPAAVEAIRQVGAVVGVLITVVGTLLGILIDRGRRHAKAAREQVENSHETNLRDESDERHGENVSRLSTLEDGQLQLRKAVGSIQDHLGIERTIPRPPPRRPPPKKRSTP